MFETYSNTKTSEFISEHIRNLIVQGEWATGIKIPTEKQLAKDFEVCPATIQKSLKVLQEEGMINGKRGVGRFVVNLTNRSKTGLVNIVVLDPLHIYHPIISQTIQGISKIITENSYHMKISSLKGKKHNLGQFNHSSEWKRLFDPSSIDGAIIATQFLSRRAVEWLADRVPVVSLNSLNAHPRISCVQVDAISGAYQAVRHLISLGHRNLAVVTTGRHCTFGQQHQDGARLACFELVSSGQGSIEFLEVSDFDAAEARKITKKWLAQKSPATGVFCGSDELTLGFYQAISEEGVRVPEDLSLISANDTLTHEQIPCPMTTTASDHAKLGRHAAQRLFEMIDKPHQGGAFSIIPSRLIVRNSCCRLS